MNNAYIVLKCFRSSHFEMQKHLFCDLEMHKKTIALGVGLSVC